MQNLVLVLSSTKMTDQITAFIDAHATVCIPVEKRTNIEAAFLAYFQWTKSRRLSSVMNLLPSVIHNTTWKS